MIKLQKSIFKELVILTEEHKPDEVGAYLFKDNTVIKPMNKDGFRWCSFQDIDPEETYNWVKEFGKPSAIFHSHPCEAIPSITDKAYMHTTIQIYNCVWLIMSNKLKVRAWTIENFHIKEIEVKIYEDITGRMEAKRNI